MGGFCPFGKGGITQDEEGVVYPVVDWVAEQVETFSGVNQPIRAK